VHPEAYLSEFQPVFSRQKNLGRILLSKIRAKTLESPRSFRRGRREK